MATLENAIIDVVNYYSYFNYPVTSDKIFKYISIPINRSKLDTVLASLVKKKELKSKIISQAAYYTMPSKGIDSQSIASKREHAKRKLKKIDLVINLLALFPQIRLIGLSGSIALFQASEDDDIDLFVITAEDRLFTARFICIAIVSLFRFRRKRQMKTAANKICLNMFIDERELSLPINKRNRFTAHELLQMKPIINKGHTYNNFLKANSWVNKYFPNMKDIPVSSEDAHFIATWDAPTLRRGGTQWSRKMGSELRNTLLNKISDLIEKLLKLFQLFFINRHKTSELITSTQLWFHPEDFELKLRKNKII